MQNKQSEKYSKQEMISMYNEDVQKLLKYVPWLESKKGINLTSYYSGELENTSLSIPTYDPTLLSFIKDVEKTKLMEKNYQYIYSKHAIRTYRDEWKVIEKATLSEVVILKAIITRYISKGRVKSVIWNEGVENEAYLRVLLKLKDLMETWDKPLA